MKAKPSKSKKTATSKSTMTDDDILDPIKSWRQQEFEKMGFSETVALYLADTRTDLRAMENLLEKGCDHELAMQILVDDRILI